MTSIAASACTLINARGTSTYLSGSLELPEVRRAMDDAARHFVDMFELQHAAGRRLAQLSGAESGMVTSGAAGAMAAADRELRAGDPRIEVLTSSNPSFVPAAYKGMGPGRKPPEQQYQWPPDDCP